MQHLFVLSKAELKSDQKAIIILPYKYLHTEVSGDAARKTVNQDGNCADPLFRFSEKSKRR